MILETPHPTPSQWRPTWYNSKTGTICIYGDAAATDRKWFNSSDDAADRKWWNSSDDTADGSIRGYSIPSPDTLPKPSIKTDLVSPPPAPLTWYISDFCIKTILLVPSHPHFLFYRLEIQLQKLLCCIVTLHVTC